MPVFQYVARNPMGQTVKGQIEAQNPNMVARALRDQGLVPTSIEMGSAAASRGARQAGKGGKV
jgi:type II secretory pathway component PulF